MESKYFMGKKQEKDKVSGFIVPWVDTNHVYRNLDSKNFLN